MRGRTGGKAGSGRARRLLPLAVSVALGGSLVVGPGRPVQADPVLSGSGIRTQQLSVVAAAHQVPLTLARYEVAQWAASVAADTRAVASDQNAQASATVRAADAADRLVRDQGALAAADNSLAQAQARLAGDRNQLRAIAIGMYTGSLTNPQPSSLRQLEAEQSQIIDADEVELIASVVDTHVHADLATTSSDTRHQHDAAGQVQTDRTNETQAAIDATTAAARTSTDEKTLASDQASLSGANGRLDAQESALAAALASVAGPVSTPSGELSLLGGSALDAAQLAGWFNAQGYVDFTSAPIQLLAAWYIQSGSEEGVRGDVAFAQAVLETGGFSSPDAVNLSNFAGIGHCDTCASGWGFPSPQEGVLGQVQLLRIFADAGPGPAKAPPPAIASLSPAHQMSAGCCSTVESLTGVWATDPTYGQQILLIYGQMLGYALSTPAD